MTGPQITPHKNSPVQSGR